MVELYDIIEAANKNVSSTRGTLVLHRSIQEHPTFKVYKKFCYKLYLVKADKKKSMLTWEFTKNSPSDNLMEDWIKMDKEYLVTLITWLSSNFYKELRDEI